MTRFLSLGCAVRTRRTLGQFEECNGRNEALLPRSEVVALVDLVEVDQAAMGARGPTSPGASSEWTTVMTILFAVHLFPYAVKI